MRNANTEQQKQIANKILEEVSSYFEVDIYSKSRKRNIVYARFTAISLIYNFCDKLTCEYIGSLFNQNHSNVIHARKTSGNLIKYDSDFREDYNHLHLYIDNYIKKEKKEYYERNLRLNILSKINRTLRSMDLVLLHNIQINLQEWNQSNGKQLKKNTLDYLLTE